MKKFLLNKYYMDCVTGSGQVVVAYATEITWGAARIRHSSILTPAGQTPNNSRTTFFKGTFPCGEQTPAGQAWHWHCPALDAQGSWENILDSHPGQVLHETPDGKQVVWHCLSPLARTKIRVGKTVYTGNGYIERLTMTLEPWLLPVDTLHWGRFHGEAGDSLTWIFWQGPKPLALLLGSLGEIPLDSGFTPPGHAGHYEWPGNRLSLNGKTILRQGDISTTALKLLPRAVKSLFPQQILHLRETKWAGTGTWYHEGSAIPGFSIHELVNFRQPCSPPTV